MGKIRPALTFKKCKVLFAAVWFSLAPAASAATNYNVLFIAVDDLRPELNCYGASRIVSPNIDRLANSGRLFRRHYAAVPTCGASRYAMLTGKRPTTQRDTQNNAFDQLVDEDYLDGHIAQAAVAKLQEFKQEGTRFMMAVGFLRPHLPFNAPKAYYDLYDSNNDLANTKLNVQSTRAGTTNYNGWKSTHFSPQEQTNAAISGLQADPDSDGVSNIFECLSGTNPRSSLEAARMIGEIQNLAAYGLADDYFTARFAASAQIDDIAFSLNASTNLESWASSLAFVTNAPLGGGFLIICSDPPTRWLRTPVNLSA